jgi:cytochrome P450
MVAENAESFAVMLGERTQGTMENPEARMAQRKFLAPGFTERATAGYIEQVRGVERRYGEGLRGEEVRGLREEWGQDKCWGIMNREEI